LKKRCHVIVTQQSTTVEQCARKFRNVSANEGVDMSELQARHCITPE